MVTLSDGHEIEIRPIRPSDADRLVRFHEGLSAATTRLRFFVYHPHLTDAEVRRFTCVDHLRRETLVALVADDIVGVGRYDRLDGTRAAEVAFVVTDRWQGLGIGSALFYALARKARNNGICRFVADTLSENRQMLELFEHTGTVSHQSIECGVVELDMNIRRAS